MGWGGVGWWSAARGGATPNVRSSIALQLPTRWPPHERLPSHAAQHSTPCPAPELACTSGSPSAAPSRVQVRSEPPRPRVVMAPAQRTGGGRGLLLQGECVFATGVPPPPPHLPTLMRGA